MDSRWFAWVSHLLYRGDFRRTLNRVEGGLPLERHGPYNAKADSNVLSNVGSSCIAGGVFSPRSEESDISCKEAWREHWHWHKPM